MEGRSPALSRLHHKALEFQAALDRCHTSTSSFSLVTSIKSGDHARRDYNLLRYSLRACMFEMMMKWPEFVAEGDLLQTMWWRPVVQRPLELLQMEGAVGTLEQLRVRLEREQMIDEVRGDLLTLFATLNAKLYQAEFKAISDLAYDLILWMAELEKLSGNLQLAMEHCRRAMEMIPTYGQAMLVMSGLKAMEGRVVEAFELSLRAAVAQVACPKATESVLIAASKLVNIPADGQVACILAFTAAILLHELRASGQRTHQIDTLIAKLTTFKTSHDDGLVIAVSCLLMAHDLLNPKGAKLSTGQLRMVPVILRLAATSCTKIQNIIVTWMWSTEWSGRVLGSRPAEESSFEPLCLRLIQQSELGVQVCEEDEVIDVAVDATDSGEVCLLPEDLSLLGTASYAPLREELQLNGPSAMQVTNRESERRRRGDRLLESFIQPLELVIRIDGKLHWRAGWEQEQRRQTSMTRLAQQRLHVQVQSMEAAFAVTQIPWTIIDADTLLAHWDRLSQLVEQRRIRLLLPMAVLRELDWLKGSGERVTIARQAIRQLADWSKKSHPAIRIHSSSHASRADVQALQDRLNARHLKDFVVSMGEVISWLEEEHAEYEILCRSGLLVKHFKSIGLPVVRNIELWLSE